MTTTRDELIKLADEIETHEGDAFGCDHHNKRAWAARIRDALKTPDRGEAAEPVGTEALVSVLKDYRCSYTVDEEGCGLPLVDVLTPNGSKDISPGNREIELLADYIASDLFHPATEPAPAAAVGVPEGDA